MGIRKNELWPTATERRDANGEELLTPRLNEEVHHEENAAIWKRAGKNVFESETVRVPIESDFLRVLISS